LYTLIIFVIVSRHVRVNFQFVLTFAKLGVMIVIATIHIVDRRLTTHFWTYQYLLRYKWI